MAVKKAIHRTKETVDKIVKWENDNHKAVNSCLSSLFIIILALYPMRHIHWGLDLWDTGYSYANFEYMGLEHMDPMWLFSTYLANAVGHLLTMLPMGGTLVGMNFYTGLFVSLLALLGYFFCTKKLEIPPFFVFVGEFTAISLCWCPTASFYNYLTFVFFLGGFILLYRGLTEEKKWYLFAAGICLGTNVLVRFSNLAETGMIVAVWAYGIIEALDDRKNKQKIWNGKNIGKGAWSRTVSRTLWCLGGYLSALGAAAVYIQVRYGLNSYAAGIRRLFAMTDQATDYKATSMVMGVLQDYLSNLYWVARIFIIIFVGVLFFVIVRFLTESKNHFRKHPEIAAGIKIAARVLWIYACWLMLMWLKRNNVYSFDGYLGGASAVYRTGILFLTAAIVIAAIRIFHPKSRKEERLLGGMLILLLVLTSIGSNNRNYPSINNLFVAAPYTIWQCWIFCRKKYDNEVMQTVIFPVKAVFAALLLLFVVHSVHFGANFLFEDTKGAQNLTATIDNNEVLKGIKMSPERAEWMSSISEYVEREDLQGREVILYGKIPSLSYYLQMPSAFNPWSDLLSYSYETMKQDLAETEAQMEQDSKRPVIIVTHPYAFYREGGIELMMQKEVNEDLIYSIEQDQKWELLMQFMKRKRYEKTFFNDKFVIFE